MAPCVAMRLDIPEGDFDGFIFDCDGTLAHSMPLHLRAWRTALASAGAAFEFPSSVFYTWGGIPTREIVVRLNGMFGTGLDADAVARHKEQLYLGTLGEVGPIGEVVDFARRAADAAQPIAVASGGSQHVVLRTLANIGVSDLFRIVVTPEFVERGKPHPDMFLFAADKMGIPPGRCLVFEDTPMGFQAAEAAGMRWVRVPPPEGD